MRRFSTRMALMLAVVGALLAPAFASAPTSVAAGSITFDGSPGTNAPPSTLGPFTMTAFGIDSTPDGTSVTSVTDPPAGTITFDHELVKTTIGEDWGTWSHGFDGSVYTNIDGAPAQDALTIGLPANTVAFYTYIEPNDFGTFDITATAQDGTSSGATAVTGQSGAKYFGFSGDPANPIVSISITADSGAEGFAVGEFGIATAFTSDVSVTKVVSGSTASAPFTVAVACTYGDPQTITFPATGGTQTVTVPSFLEQHNTCSFTETDSAGAATVSYACTGSVPPQEIPSSTAVDPVCVSAGPQATPVSVNILDPTQTAAVTITNTFIAPVVIAPKFTG